MVIERDISIVMNDGSLLRADVFRPRGSEPVPVIMTMGPYGKGIHYSDGYAPEWQWLVERHPEILEESSGKLMVWETPDPERWVPWNYAVIRVDSRGSGRSPGVLDCFSPREIEDFRTAIDWAGSQDWSNGRVGLLGVSYYAITQWLVAATQPEHLAAIIPWEGACDFYRDVSRHGGILSNFFVEQWYPGRVLRNQHGLGGEGLVDAWLGESATGPETVPAQLLARDRVDLLTQMRKRPLDDEWYRDRSADLSRVSVPLLSGANWAGCGLHGRGNFHAFTSAASPQKWLEVHGGRHEEWFYLPDGLDLQRRFLDRFLHDVQNGWEDEPPVRLHIRRPGERFELRAEQEWPLARTQWTELHLDASDLSASWNPPPAGAIVSFDALGENVTFLSAPLTDETELTGPVSARLEVSSSTTDADLFVTLRAFDCRGEEVTFEGATEQQAPLAQGWLRLSHREVDPDRSTPWQPYHSHRREASVEATAVVSVEVELWPTCLVLPEGYRLGVTIGGQDFARNVLPGQPRAMQGSGPFIHNDVQDRDPSIFGGRTTLHTGPELSCSLLIPIIPAATSIIADFD